MWHWSQQPPISTSFVHGHAQSHIPGHTPGHTPSHTPSHQLPTHPMAVHHLTPQMTSHFTSGQPPFIGYPQFNQGEFPHSSVPGYSSQLVAPPTQLPMPGGTGWAERHVGNIPSEHLLPAVGGGYPTRGLNHESVPGGPSVGQAMAALTPTPGPALPQTPPLPPASCALPGASLRTSPLEPLVSPHVSTPQQQLSHPAVGSSPFSVDFILRERPASMEGGEIPTHGYTQQDMRNSVTSNFPDGAEGMGRYATHTPQEMAPVPSGFGEGGEQGFPPPCPPGGREPFGDGSRELQQFADSSETLAQFPGSSDDLPQLSQQEVAEETAGTFPDKLSPFQLPSDFSSPNVPPEDSDKLAIALPPEKPFSPPQLVLTNSEESQPQDLDQSDHSSIAMQRDLTGSHVTGTVDSSPRSNEGVSQQGVGGGRLSDQEPREKAPPALSLPVGEPGPPAKDTLNRAAEDRLLPVGPSKTTVLSRRPFMVRHKHDYESEDDDVFLPNSPHHPTEEQSRPPEQPHPPGQDQPRPPEQGGEEQPCPLGSRGEQPRPLGSGEEQPRPLGSGEEQPRPLGSGGEQPRPLGSGEEQPRPLGSGEEQPRPLGSGEEQPRPPEYGGEDQYSPEQSGWSRPHPPELSEVDQPHPHEQSGGDSPEQSGWSQPHPPEPISSQSQVLKELDVGNPSSSTANQVPAAGVAPPLVYRRRRGPRVALDQEKLQLPLTKGWRRLVRTRHLPDQLPRVDICYVTPSDRRLRTFPEIQRYLDNSREAGGEAVGVAGLELEHFSFSKKAEVGEMIEIGGKLDESNSEGLNAMRKTGRGRRKVAREPNAPEAAGIHVHVDGVPTKTEGRGRGRGRRRGRPPGSGGGLGRGARKQREDKIIMEPQQGATGGHSLEDQVSMPAEPPLPTVGVGLPTVGAGFSPLSPEGMEAQGHRISLEPHEILQLPRTDDADSCDMPVGLHGNSHDVYQSTHGAVNHTGEPDAASAAGRSEERDAPAASGGASLPSSLPVDPSPLSTHSLAAPTIAVGQPPSATPTLPSSAHSLAAPTIAVGQPPSATPTLPSSAASKPEGVRKRGRKRLDPTRIEPSSAPHIKRPRGRPKGSGRARKELPTAATAQPQVHVKKRRGRRPKLHLPASATTRHLVMAGSAPASQDGGLGSAVCAIAGSPEPLKDGSDAPSSDHAAASAPGVSVIVPALPTTTGGRHEAEQHVHGKTRKEEKRRQLLLKARVDRAKKKADSKHIQRAIITQRRLAQRQRRERERMLMKQARDRQEKLTRHKETEERELRRQRLAQQRVVENQRRAQERTRRLLAHLRQQEVERERLAVQHQRDKERAEQLKRPTEDLLVTDLAPLPPLHPMTWVVLPAPAFANLLMAVEFGRSFEEFLQLGRLPSVWELVGGLYSLDTQPLELFCVQLLRAVLYSPGSDARTMSGCAIGRIEVRGDTLSELLRLYLTEMAELEEIASALRTLPLAALRPSQKAGLLGFLVEELLASTALTREVDTRMDQLAALRRDKWKISLKIKRFRSRLSEVYGVGLEKKPVVYSGRGRPPKRALMGLNLPDVGGDSSDEGEDPANPTTNEELEQDSESEYSEEETDEETPEAKEELQKRIRVLKKKLQCLRVLIHSSSRQMRKFPLGLDRYARQYWLLPGLGGIIVEGVETSLRGNHHWDLGRCSDENLVGGVVGGVVKAEEEASFHGHDQSDLSAGEVSEVDVVCVDSEVKSCGGVQVEDGGGVLVGDGGGVQVGGCAPGSREKGVKFSPSVEHQRLDDSRRPSFEVATGLQEGERVPSEQSNPSSITSVGTGLNNPMAGSRDPETAPIAVAMVNEPQLEDAANGVPVVRMWNGKSELDMQFGTAVVNSDDIRTRLPFAESDTPPLPLPLSKAAATPALDRTRVLNNESQSPSPGAVPIPDHVSMESSPSVGSQTDTAPSVSSSTAVLTGDTNMLSPPNSPRDESLGNNVEERGAPQLECTETTPTFSREPGEVPPDRPGPSSPSLDPLSSQALVARGQPAGPSPAPASHDSRCPSPCPSPQPWFSIFPRQPCERATYATVDPSQMQLAGGQQFLMAAPTPQYAYMTQGGKTILSQPMIQQVGVGYTLVGNTLVPQAQYVSVNPTQAVQYAVGQQGVQYVTIGGQQQPQGVVAVAGQQQPQGVVAIGGQQQPQGVVAVGGQQQPQGVVAIGGQQQPQGIVAIGGQQQPQGVVAIGGQQQPQGMVAIGGQQQPQGVVAIGGQQQPQGIQVVIGNQQAQGVLAIGAQQPQGVVAIGGQQQPQGVVAIGGQQQPHGVVAIGGQQQPQGVVAIGAQQPQGVVAVGAQQPQGMQYISLGGGQVAVVQTGGEVGVAPVETPTEESEVGGASAAVGEAMDGETVPPQGKQQDDADSAQPSSSPAHPETSSSPAVASLSEDGTIPEDHTPNHTPSHGPKLSESEVIHRVPNPVQPSTSQLVVQGDASETTPSATPTSQYLTAVLPTGPGGQSQYVTLPADPRVLAGQCSYAVLQQPDGSSQIVLVENSSLGYSQSGVMPLECPPPSLMCNEGEAQPWLTDITLMYAEHLPFLTPHPPHVETPPPREKTLPQLLAEQDRGLTHGWWQVTDTRQVDRILRSLSHRGYREKGLFKALQKNKEQISKLLEPSELIRCQTSFAELPKGGGKVGGVQSEAANSKRSEPSDLKVGEVQSSDDSGSEEAMEVEGKPLDAQLDKEIGSVKATNHSSDDDHMTEATNHNSDDHHMTEANSSVHDMMFPELACEAALQVLEYLEGMQERLFEAELQSVGSTLRPPLSDSLREEKPAQGFPLPSIASALLHLELSVDRRYLKPPLIAKSLVQDKPRTGSPYKGGRGRRAQPPPPPKAFLEAPPTTELLQWRSAVGKASSASQLAVCANQLECCVAWEKSNTKVFCKVCHSSESESLLLLCDCCDRGTHTYCCKPKLSSIPDGDWYCAECAVAKRKLGSCDVCESPRGVLLHCTGCARTVHKRCLNPPLRKMPSLPWQCHKCKKNPPRARSKAGTSSPAKKRPPKPLDDMAICRQMLRALEQHEEAGPFLEPVRKRKFPEYFRVIKRPMDFHTIKIRLREGRYPDKEAFAEEVRLVFSNCAFYNEDDSEIGVAGHCMKAFFEKRWSELSQ